MPLTTYTFSTNASSEDPVSASDEERLPAGGFSLRHGFPHWFGRAKRNRRDSAASSRAMSVNGLGVSNGETATSTANENPTNDTTDLSSTSQPQADEDNGSDEKKEGASAAAQPIEPRKTVPVSELLDYIRSSFDTESVLDSLPLEAAGNPGAWHAWQAHRRGNSSSASKYGSKQGSPQARLPGDWHWDGIWAKRAQNEIENSHSDPMLFGNAARGGGDEMVCCELSVRVVWPMG